MYFLTDARRDYLGHRISTAQRGDAAAPKCHCSTQLHQNISTTHEKVMIAPDEQRTQRRKHCDKRRMSSGAK
jgi:hypothetical protein